MRFPSTVTITEVGPRDGLQNEALFLTIEQKAELIERLVATGIRRIEAASFVSPKAIPQMRDAADLMARLPRRPGVTYVALVPNAVGAPSATPAPARALSTPL